MRKRLALIVNRWPAAKRVNAYPIRSLSDLPNAPADRYVAVETENFGWIFTPKGENGKRRIYLKE